MAAVHHLRHVWGPADRVTLVRAVLACVVGVLVVAAPQQTTLVASLASTGLVLDGVDGWVARRTRTASSFGARFDMEVDAFLILVLSVHAALTTAWWALLIGAARYLLLAAGRAWPWLRAGTPPRRWAKVVAVVQGVVLVVVAAQVLPDGVARLLLAGALALLAESFGHQVWQLHRQRRDLAAGPAAWRRTVGAVGLRVVALLVGPVVLLHLLDLGFGIVLDRPFEPLTDATYLGPALGVLEDSNGAVVTGLAVVGAVLLALVLLVVLPHLLLRLGRRVLRRGSPATRGLAVLAGLGLVVYMAGYAAGVVDRVRDGLDDRVVFAGQIEQDAYAAAPPGQLLTGLRGKDVLLVFVESYGRVAIQGSWFAPAVAQVLDEGTEQLAAAGFGMRSAFLTSPTFGAASWLAHATLQSGLWVDSQGRYDQLMTADRLTLTSAFDTAGWRTVFDVPANTRDWPEGERFYGFDELYDARNVGYAGPKLGYAPVPDQYTLAHFREQELAGEDRPPVMAEIDLVSSHHPWQPLPPMLPWTRVGDGSVYAEVPLRDDAPVQQAYARSVRYSWRTLVSFLERWPDRDLVLVVLGDHQPHGYVSGPDPGHDVPVSVIARDAGVLERIEEWGWQPGLRPSPDAPVWRMDAFRDRFLDAFSR